MEIYDNYSLTGLNTFGIDVRARRVVYLQGSTLDEPFRFRRDVEALLEGDFLKYPYMLIGEGSNMVFTKDYEGTVIKVGEAVFHGGDDGGYKYLTVGARMLTDEVVRLSVGYKYYGMENLSAIPGTIGAAVVQNVGAYGVEIKDLVETVEAVDLLSGEWREFSCEECAFGYRTSLFKQQVGRWLIWRVKLRFNKEYKPILAYKALADELQRRGIVEPSQQQVRDVVTELRWSKLPRPEEHGSAGSFFKNPVVDEATATALKTEYPDMPVYPGYKLSAGWLIDQCGWKGKTMGRAGVWPKQALVLYNAGGCTGAEVAALAKAIQQDVKHKFGVALDPEAIII
jgi:UDP-N-acetylmuramate dehydrogenase